MTELELQNLERDVGPFDSSFAAQVRKVVAEVRRLQAEKTPTCQNCGCRIDVNICDDCCEEGVLGKQCDTCGGEGEVSGLEVEMCTSCDGTGRRET